MTQDLVAAALSEDPNLASLPWADLGTGSGAIAIGTAAELKKLNQVFWHRQGWQYGTTMRCPYSTLYPCTQDTAVVWAVDLSEVAVAHAEFNASMCGAAGIVRVVQGSWCTPLNDAGLGNGSLGGLLSNPPYIPRKQVTQPDPQHALCVKGITLCFYDIES